MQTYLCFGRANVWVEDTRFPVQKRATRQTTTKGMSIATEYKDRNEN